MTWKYRAQQNEGELREYVKVLKEAKIKSYLEIGCKWGGTLYRVAKEMPEGSKIVAVDMPTGDTLPSLKDCISELGRMGYDAHLYVGDSTDPKIVSAVREQGRFDACLIDANHTIEYVLDDYTNYGPLTKILAFHDISHKRPQQPGRLPIEVPQFWESIKTLYRHVEIKHEPMDNGFGILYRNDPMP